MGLTGSTNEERIWNYLKGRGLSDAGAAGLMGNLYAESGLRPNNLQNAYEAKLGYTDDTYTAAVDSGKYTNFVHDSAGYGLAQWTFWSRKQNMLAYHKAAGKSIGDLETQLGFLAQELGGYKSLFATLKTTASVQAASDAVLTQFERPADTGVAVKAKRASYGQTYYDKYATRQTSANPANAAVVGTGAGNALRQKVCDTIGRWVGATKGSATHLEILNIYNGHKPLARGYAVKPTDAYCATAASAAYIEAGIAEYTGTECSCYYFVEEAKKRGIWTENDAYIPDLGDACLYDWQDSGAGDNTGTPDHIGIVTSVSRVAGTFTVTEGNMSGGKVGRRTMQFNGKYIRGFITPDFDAIAKKLGGSATVSPAPAQTAAAAPATAQQARTYTVKRGDSLWAIAAKYLGSGSRYREIQTLNGLKNTTIYAGQVLKLPAE